MTDEEKKLGKNQEFLEVALFGFAVEFSMFPLFEFNFMLFSSSSSSFTLLLLLSCLLLLLSLIYY